MLPCRGHQLHVRSAGVRATLIDFSLSRLRTDAGHVAFFDLATDPELFQGPKGDVQVGVCRLLVQSYNHPGSVKEDAGGRFQ